MSEAEKLLSAWKQVPRDLERLIAGRSDDEIAGVPGSEDMSLRELVHHITEANVVAASMMIAALGASGSTFDWSWLFPNKEWTTRLGYNRLPTEPALMTLDSLIKHVSNLILASEGTLSREVTLFDAPGDETYTKTVRELIQMEIDHSAQHLGDAK